MDTNIDGLRSFLDRIRNIGFWERIFSWGSVKSQLMDAAADIQKLVSTSAMLQEQNAEFNSRANRLEAELRIASESVVKKDSEIVRLNSIIQENNARITQTSSELSARETTLASLNDRRRELEIELATFKTRLTGLEEELKTTRQKQTELSADEANRKEKYERDVAALNSIREQIQNDRNREIEEKNIAEQNRIKSLKETWNRHEENVKSVIKNICNKHTIEYVEKVSFRGEPDNTLKISDELIIFDAKSPGSDDLNNFPSYLKAQAESAKKYAKQENVKADIFFVVPTNTLEKLTNFVYNLGDYNVYIISLDSVEQIILGLKKIEEYDFTEQLSPEERDNICRILGKFAHLSKRRLQIDSFFAKQFMELLYKSETALPAEILEKAGEYERSEKLNPPVEKRVKSINVRELERDTLYIGSEANSKGIVSDDHGLAEGLNGLQLYKGEVE